MDLVIKKWKIILLILSCFIFCFSFIIVASDLNEEDLSLEEKFDSLTNHILESSDELILSQENITVATQLLAALPDKEDRPTIAVYEILDKTGQYNELGAPVVTQGATDMMITALMRSRQFRVLGRVNFSNFVNEQSLQIGERLAEGQNPVVGELTGADYIMEGAVTEYQVDKKSGGLGIAIGGVGATDQYAVASTAIDLRLLNTTTGEVVWAKSLKREITGEKIGLQLFSFIGNNVVEFETGRGKQEVINLVIRTLLEEAVFKLATNNNF